jgi:hypothetical protein
MPFKRIIRGFVLPCIRCGERGYVSVELHDVTAFTCGDCDGEFTIEDVQAILDEWGPVRSWLESAPEKQ